MTVARHLSQRPQVVDGATAVPDRTMTPLNQTPILDSTGGFAARAAAAAAATATHCGRYGWPYSS
jgi:hypothetical protein